MPELEVCPFCARPAIRTQHPGLPENKALGQIEGALMGLWYVGCPEIELDDNKCEVHPGACWYARLSDAEDAWNTRKGG